MACRTGGRAPGSHRARPWTGKPAPFNSAGALFSRWPAEGSLIQQDPGELPDNPSPVSNTRLVTARTLSCLDTQVAGALLTS